MKADVAKNFEQLNELNQTLLGALVRFNEIASGRMEQLLKLNNAIINESLESSIQYFKSLSELKKPEDAMTSQMAYFNEAGKKAAENVKKYFSLAMETNAEVNTVLQQNLESVASKASVARKAA